MIFKGWHKPGLVDENNQDYLTEVTNEVMALGPYFRAVVDSLDFFLQRDDPARVVAMVRMLQAHARMYRGLLFITVSTDSLSPNVKQELSSIADMVLSFQVRTIGTDFETSMMVSKFNAPENLKILVSGLLPKKESLQRPSNVLPKSHRYVQRGRA